MSETPKEREKRVVPGMLVSGDIVARGGRYYRNARFIIVAMFMGWGIWCAHDGFYKYPRENEQQKQKFFDRAAKELGRDLTAEEKQKNLEGNKLPHTDLDITLNRVLAFVLPPASLLVLAWTLYNSRGEIRLSGETLSIPGHPPIALSAIQKIDKTRWDKKGIALLEYELPGGGFASAKIDDFVYAQDPTDAIVDRVEAYVAERCGDGIHQITQPPKPADD